MRYLLIAIMILVGSPVYAIDEWDKTEIGMEVVYIGLHLVDWGQTLNIARDDRFYEMNPVIGKHPSRGRVNTMFAAGLILQPIIAHVLPRNWRKAWIGSGILLEIGCVGNNYHVGIRASL